jgi:hypothetical protein
MHAVDLERRHGPGAKDIVVAMARPEDLHAVAVPEGESVVASSPNSTASPSPSPEERDHLVVALGANPEPVDAEHLHRRTDYDGPNSVVDLERGVDSLVERHRPVLSDAGGAPDVVNCSLTLDDEAASALPDSGQIACLGAYRPANHGAGDPFPAPSGQVNLSSFDGAAPNGTWSLYVVDDAAADTGHIDSWSLAVTAGGPPPPPPPTRRPTEAMWF